MFWAKNKLISLKFTLLLLDIYCVFLFNEPILVIIWYFSWNYNLVYEEGEGELIVFWQRPCWLVNWFNLRRAKLRHLPSKFWRVSWLKLDIYCLPTFIFFVKRIKIQGWTTVPNQTIILFLFVCLAGRVVVVVVVVVDQLKSW